MAISVLKSGMPKGYGSPEREPVVYEVTYEGAVLSLGERNYHDDSDFFARVWDGEKIINVEYATTRSWTYANGATIDATPEVIAAASEWQRKVLVSDLLAQSAAKARAIETGKAVVVVKGRKVPIGTEGIVFWKGIDKFKSNHYSTAYRIGFKDAEGETHWTAESNVEVIAPESYEITAEEAEAQVPQVRVSV